MSLDQRRERGDLIEVFKILKGHTKIDPSLFWEVREARNGARLVKNRAVNGRRQRQKFFSYMVIQRWNLLPMDLRKAPSIDSFKTKLDALIMKEAWEKFVYVFVCHNVTQKCDCTIWTTTCVLWTLLETMFMWDYVNKLLALPSNIFEPWTWNYHEKFGKRFFVIALSLTCRFSFKTEPTSLSASHITMVCWSTMF